MNELLKFAEKTEMRLKEGWRSSLFFTVMAPVHFWRAVSGERPSCLLPSYLTSSFYLLFILH